ncbi:MULTISPECIES: endonuclease/exonuclease/phosphatase family protein [unclassified Luteibacter]|uniref:endonuclease/exonuclease/phosphatase family protein n=1 Tax=unclassified Luteibacter TaxID=2620188 RepID=UPI0008D40FD5|nr:MULTISPECIES: endonuclease/exonuclease/phosphatase family protein [unclassified Luteibacter]MDR6937229.1 endonuclease/exonuclease/phosphatase family metal-dependent hydrolase [Luteibacter sp. 3190]SEO43031.1 Metal-dependent hydrolase, endonuclease/exonuclease/phosphatase family [Luteibacter sp. UNC138MFCol5.1]SEW12573.1 Metal-dependent hydrolase, endonuclease/exonuclease/phosphatase family [Luteibacter sp. 329MFSha]
MTRASPKLQPASPQCTLRLLSCNILAGASVQRYSDYVTRSVNAVLPGRAKLANLDSLAELLHEFDVVGLQEADAGSLRSGFLNQTRYIAEAAGMPYWSHQPNRPMARVAHSANGLLSRLEPSEVIDYPLPGRIKGRGALFVRFGQGDDALVVVIAHLSLGAAARMGQLAFIAELLAPYPHAVLMGDLNTEPTSAEMRHLFAKTALQPPATPTPTFPSWKPRRALDHILTSTDIALERTWTLPRAFSDHLPIAAEIRLPIALAQAAGAATSD